jgi:hypothetical protein
MSISYVLYQWIVRITMCNMRGRFTSGGAVSPQKDFDYARASCTPGLADLG